MEIDLLNKVICGFRQKDVKSFENLFLLTYKNTLSDIVQYIDDDALVMNILKKTYIKLWNRAGSIPEQSLLRAWIRILIKESFKNIENLKNIEISDFVDDNILKEKDIEQKAITALIEIEEELGISIIEDVENKGVKIVKTILRMIFLFIIGFLAIFTLLSVFSILKDIIKKENISDKIKIEKNIEIKEKKDKKKPLLGWNEFENTKKYRKSNGKMAENEFLKINNSIYYFSSDGSMYKGSLRRGIFEYIFDDDGKLIKIDCSKNLYKSDNDFLTKLREEGFVDRADNIIEYSDIEDENFIYFLENLESRNENINLLRYNKEDKNMEKIDNDISGYLILKDKEIAYSKGDEIKFFNKYAGGEKINKAYTIDKKGDKYILLDSFGDLANKNKDSIKIDNRIYYFKNDVIDSVYSANPEIAGNIYSYKEGKNKIYINDQAFLKDGIYITAMVARGEYIYYSCVVENSDGIQKSKIARININTKEVEDVTKHFSGSIISMYYYKDYSGIYMEYLPNSPKNAYGMIAILSPENDLFVINDDNFRNSLKDSNEMLELIMIDNNGIHCYLSKCDIMQNGDLEIKSKKAVTINESSISFLER